MFKALADPTRRFLLDLLFARDGRTLTELESELEMTRFGVMKHLRVLEDAGLVVTRRSGREKLHFLNPVPIRLIHDRWIDKYTERQVSALADLKTRAGEERHDHRRRRRDAWRRRRSTGSTSRRRPRRSGTPSPAPSGRQQYGYAGRAEYDLRPGGAYQAFASEAMKAHGAPDVIIVGEVIEADPPRKLVQTWHPIWDPRDGGGGLTRLTWEIEARPGGVTRLTVTHELAGAPMTGGDGGWQDPERRRRMELDAQRPEDAARNGQVPGRLTPDSRARIGPAGEATIVTGSMGGQTTGWTPHIASSWTTTWARAAPIALGITVAAASRSTDGDPAGEGLHRRRTYTCPDGSDGTGHPYPASLPRAASSW